MSPQAFPGPTKGSIFKGIIEGILKTTYYKNFYTGFITTAFF
jgi:hypothetical protein